MILFSFCFILKPCNTQYNRCTSNRQKKARVYFYLWSKITHIKWPETFFAHFYFKLYIWKKRRFFGSSDSLKWPFKRGKINATRALWCKHRAIPASLTFLHLTRVFPHWSYNIALSILFIVTTMHACLWQMAPWWSVYKLLRYHGALCLCEKDINKKEPLLSRLKSPSCYVTVWYKIFTLHNTLC